jgi:hypothetical protein
MASSHGGIHFRGIDHSFLDKRATRRPTNLPPFSGLAIRVRNSLMLIDCPRNLAFKIFRETHPDLLRASGLENAPGGATGAQRSRMDFAYSL